MIGLIKFIIIIVLIIALWELNKFRLEMKQSYIASAEKDLELENITNKQNVKGK